MYSEVFVEQVRGQCQQIHVRGMVEIKCIMSNDHVGPPPLVGSWTDTLKIFRSSNFVGVQ